MTRSYLIDGYNLVHALGLLSPKPRAHALERARVRLLHYLAEALGDEAGQATVVFDAAHAPRGATAVQHFRDIEVRFAVGEDEADDLIETLIREHPLPRRLVVVSNDHRLQAAARKRAAEAWSCVTLVDHLEAKRRQRPAAAPPAPEKAERLTPEETRHWLGEFGDLADDPDFKEVFERFRFDEE